MYREHRRIVRASGPRLHPTLHRNAPGEGTFALSLWLDREVVFPKHQCEDLAQINQPPVVSRRAIVREHDGPLRTRSVGQLDLIGDLLPGDHSQKQRSGSSTMSTVPGSTQVCVSGRLSRKYVCRLSNHSRAERACSSSTTVSSASMSTWTAIGQFRFASGAIRTVTSRVRLAGIGPRPVSTQAVETTSPLCRHSSARVS